jgi:hypothetical protein
MNQRRTWALGVGAVATVALASGCQTSVSGVTGGATSSTTGVTTGTGNAGGAGVTTSTDSTTTSTSTTTVSSTTTSTTSSSTGSGGGSVGTEPPGAPPMTMPDGMGSTTFAVSELFLGDTDRDGTPDEVNGWKQYGFDIDGIVATPPYANLCKPVDNAPPSVHQNGDGGIDNSFGANILPILLGIESTFSQKINQGLQTGQFTIMLSMVDLGSGATYNPLLTRFYHGADLGSAPTFDGSDVWPVLPDLLTNPADITTTSVQFPASYVNDQTWVSSSVGAGVVPLILPVGGGPLNLTIEHAQIAFTMDPTHRTGTNGTISGVLSTQAFVTALQVLVSAFDPAFCDPNNTTFEAIAEQVAQASDILLDGTQDPTKTCDGISIGLGFNAALVQLGSVAAPVTPPNPCGDGGP